MYTIHLKPNILQNTGSILSELFNKDQSLFVLSDKNVGELYLDPLTKSLYNRFHRVYSYLIEVGEKSKSFNCLQNLVQWLLQNNAQRDSVVINLGGGVVSDLGGYLASSYMRGIAYINIPTTILAQVDAAIGGKTAINFCNVKNIIGAFHKPNAIIVDPYLLKTLPSQEIENGYGEIYKYSLLTDDFDMPTKVLDTDSLEFIKILKACIDYKQQIVNKDLYDKGLRRLLNLGHTAGHGIEIYFNLPHGIAVAVGILIATEISYNLKICNSEYKELIYNSFIQVFSEVKLPKQDNINFEELFSIIKNDKKRIGTGNLYWILPVEFCKVIVQSVDDYIWQKAVQNIVLSLID